MAFDEVRANVGWIPAHEVLAALGDPTRWRIVWLLRAGELSAGQIAEQFETARPTVSKHLGSLRAAGLVTAKKRGQQMVYRAEHKVIGRAAELLAGLAAGAGAQLLSFTPTARQVVDAAHAEARRLHHEAVDTSHLLLALAGSEGAVGEVVRAVASPATLRRRVAGEHGRGKAASGTMPLADDVLDVLGRASVLAQQTGHTAIGVRPLALALLSPGSTAAATADRLGMDSASLFAAVTSTSVPGDLGSPTSSDGLAQLRRTVDELAAQVDALAAGSPISVN